MFRSPEAMLSPTRERARYELHRNDVQNAGYRRSVMPLVEAVTACCSPSQRGLDFGAGPGPVVATMLAERGFSLRLYDPFFHDDPAPLADRYDFVVACEVIEHFRRPLDEFQRLYRLLNDGGRLWCKTSLYDPAIDFARWSYKNDDTHVFIYQASTIEWVKAAIGFSSVRIADRLIEFRR